LLFAHLPQDGIHVFLGCDNNPGLAFTFGCQALGNGLQVGHQTDIICDVLPHLIHKEIQAEPFGLFFNVVAHHFRKIFNGQLIFTAVGVHQIAQ